MKVVLGHSDDVDSADAIEDVISMCRKGLGDDLPQAGILFADIDFDHQLMLDEINRAFPGIALIGCTSDGAFSSVLGMEEDSVALLCLSSDKIKFAAGVGRNVSNNPGAATKEALSQASNKLGVSPEICLTFFESLTTSGLGILESIREAIGSNVPVFGGSAADDFKMKKTFQFSGSEVLSDSVPVLLIGGDVMFSHGVGAGRKPMGDKFEIKRVEGSRVYEIGDMSAIEFYEKYLGSLKDVTIEYPLAVYEGDGDDYYIRAPFSFNDDGSVDFFADIPEGSYVQMAQGNRDDMLGGVKKAYDDARAAYPGKEPLLALTTSCAGRKSILGTRTKEECENLKYLADKGMQVFGYYSFGEICPLEKGGNSRFHNETVVILMLGER